MAASAKTLIEEVSQARDTFPDDVFVSAAQAFVYNGFNIEEFLSTQGAMIKSQVKDVMTLVILIVTRGTNKAKIDKTTSEAGRELIGKLTSQLGLVCAKGARQRDTLTPSRLLVAGPPLTCRALKYCKDLPLIPRYFRHASICSMIGTNTQMKNEWLFALYANFDLSCAIDKTKAEVLEHSLKFIELAANNSCPASS